MEVEFWSNDDWYNMDYAEAVSTLNIEHYINGDMEVAEVVSKQVYIAGIIIAKELHEDGNPVGTRYWINWARSQRDKALNLGKPNTIKAS